MLSIVFATMAVDPRIIKLYKRIPEFKCVTGCAYCCCAPPFEKTEWNSLRFHPRADGPECPFLTKMGCSIYNKRPLMCRLYGCCPSAKCPKGGKPEKLLTLEEEKDILSTYAAIIKENSCE